MSLAATGGEPCAAFGRLSCRIRVVPHRFLRCAILIAGSLCWGEYDAALPGKGDAFLSPCFFVVRRFCRQLQHGCLLAFAQEGQKKSLSIGQLERIMVHMRLFTIDLAKNCRLVASGGGSAVHCDFRIEGKLRAGKHADRGAGVVRSSEPTRAGAEITRSKLIANARGTRFDVHQAIVAHGIGSSVPHLLRLTRGADHGSLDGTASMSAPQHMVLNLRGWQRDSRPRTSVRTSVGGTSQSIGWIAIRITVSNSQFWQNEPNSWRSSRNPICCGTRGDAQPPPRTYAHNSLRSSSLILPRQGGMAGGLPSSTALRKRSKSSLGNLRRSKVTPPGLTMSRPWQVTQKSSYTSRPRSASSAPAAADSTT